ncbi:hypothetical protein FRX31_028312 [Thalictrum thalictroides]|uniref:Uncharacterized protein n=1 Tax=Thalictrum thalictroides TaxID=46969 RepID=A0A7J6VB27_THATH|nr:hypothetical protein FRX31_028312 [Thalictrum thalictroides]
MSSSVRPCLNTITGIKDCSSLGVRVILQASLNKGLIATKRFILSNSDQISFYDPLSYVLKSLLLAYLTTISLKTIQGEQRKIGSKM